MKRYIIIALGIILLLSGCREGPFSPRINSYALGELMIPRWIAQGASSEDIQATLKRIKHTKKSQWTAEWVQTAEEYDKKAKTALETQKLDEVFHLFYKASLYYRIAAFPYPDTQEKKAALTLSRQAFSEALKFAPNPPQTLSIPYASQEIRGFFRVPSQKQRAPLLIIIPGLEGVKEDFFMREEKFLNAGWSVFTFDCPGTGESHWQYKPESIKILKTVLDYFEESPYIDNKNIVILGHNFGAHLALATAAEDQRIKAIAAISPPIHYVFTTTYINKLPLFMKKIFLSFYGQKNQADLDKTLTYYSLLDTKALPNIRAKILFIGSQEDMFASKEDQILLAKQSPKPIQLKIFSEAGELGLVKKEHEVYNLLVKWLRDQK